MDKGGYTELLDKNTLFYKIKEKEEKTLMIKETYKTLLRFTKNPRKVKINKKIIKNNFAKEILKKITYE